MRKSVHKVFASKIGENEDDEEEEEMPKQTTARGMFVWEMVLNLKNKKQTTTKTKDDRVNVPES